ncbi:MAG: dUTP diphosphatase [Bacteroidales bacterium]|nr:dUTP diphosphatase [Bacteroidales bacterium]
METVKVNIINRSANPMPEYATAGSAGMDLRANLAAPLELKPGCRVLVPTGLFVELPVGFEMQLRPRSGLALKSGITLLNSPGTIDSDYRGEIGVIMANLSDTTFTISHGDRICQAVVARYARVDWQVVDSLEETERGAGGFGHSGVK